MTSSALYICIDCELADASAEPTPLNEHSLCPRCGSSSVVPVDTLRELDAKRKREAQAPSRSTGFVLQHQAMLALRRRDAQPLVEYLSRCAGACCSIELHDDVVDALTKWDGWAWHVVYPWDVESDAPGFFTIELGQGVKNGPRWLISLNADVVKVESFQDETS